MHALLRNTYGVDATPYLRPPYGHHNAAVAAVAADLGYQVTALWSGDLRDSALVPEDQIVRMAYQSFVPQNIVIGHLNHPPVTHVYGQLVEIIRARRLRTVTLTCSCDRSSRTGHSVRGASQPSWSPISLAALPRAAATAP